MKKVIRSLGVVGAVTAAAVLSSAAPAVAGHEHLVKITNPATGQVTCQYIGRGATPTNDNFHDRAHSGPGQAHRGGQASIQKEAAVQGDTCDTVRGQQTPEVEPH